MTQYLHPRLKVGWQALIFRAAWVKQAPLAEQFNTSTISILQTDRLGPPQTCLGQQNVTSYFVVEPTHVNNTTNGYAHAGGTTSAIPFSDDPQILIDAITDIFNQILSVSTTFVSASLPIDVFNRVDFGDDVFLAIFRADPDSKPFWNGNLKKLRLAEDPPGNPVLLDANGSLAINPIDGRISKQALTFWTDPDHVPEPPADEEDWTFRHDGRSTRHGGAGGTIPGFAPEDDYHPGLSNPTGIASAAGPRRLFTEDTNFANGFRALNANISTAEDLLQSDDYLFSTVLEGEDCGASGCTSYESSDSAVQQLAVQRMIRLIGFARGLKYNELEELDEDAEKREWFMGDPLHSRPRPINYGASGPEEAQQVRVMMTTNDGLLHMFDAETGMENWAFMPRSVMPVLRRLADNQPGPPGPIHPYTIDSSVTTLVIDGNRDNQITTGGDDRVITVVGMRRGGSYYYALDVTHPDNPEFLWKIGPDSPGFGQIGADMVDPGNDFSSVDPGRQSRCYSGSMGHHFRGWVQRL
ncbi:MAG: PilC/PilY family type IV pilus protein [Gammaproteobacteria bacterium]|nr:PilC/PilY family type IV pilus protein [Gammaproteobacteria bacterium]